MKSRLARGIALGVFLAALVVQAAGPAAAPQEKDFRGRVLADRNLRLALAKAKETLRAGFNAGTGYPEVWIRDLNTFIELSLEVNGPRPIRDSLLMFFKFQAPDGNIPDGYVPLDKGYGEYFFRLSPLAPGFKAHKNTVETDQETSLIQAVRKYVALTAERDFLEVEVGPKKVWQRLRSALLYLTRYRWSEKHGLLWGATTTDWGDVQPEHPWGVEVDDSTHRAVDIYDNAMLVIALRDYLELVRDKPEEVGAWTPRLAELRANVRRQLWDAKRRKFIPHLYLDGSPFPPSFREDEIYYHGGTAVAIEAGLLAPEEAREAYARMADNVRKSGAESIGLTMYPPYPAGLFQNPSLAKPYSYINGGDWTWFGARMVRELIRLGFYEEAYRALKPMADRVVRDGGYFEWYTRDHKPQGSGLFKGAAGTLGLAIEELLSWAGNPAGRP